MLQDRTYCFISVTGRTKANIKLAIIATESGIKTIAVTLDTNSRIAEVCKTVVPLKINKVTTPTAGFNTFVVNVVTCLQIAGVTVPNKFDIWHKKGVELSVNLLLKSITLLIFAVLLLAFSICKFDSRIPIIYAIILLLIAAVSTFQKADDSVKNWY